MLTVTSASPHKNLRVAARAVQALAKECGDGNITWRVTVTEGEFERATGIRVTDGETTWLRCEGEQTQEQVRRLYAQSDLLLFPSICESFGLPLIEAAQHGCEIIAADADYAHEVAPSASYADPHDSEDWRDRILDVWESIQEEESVFRLRKQRGAAKPAARLPSTNTRTWADVAEDLFELILRAPETPGVR